MNQKTFVILFVIVTVAAGIGISFTKFKEFTYSSASPSPSPQLNFRNLSTPTPSAANSPNPTAASRLQPTTQPSSAPQQIAVVKQYLRFPGVLSEDQLKNKKVTIVTEKGNIEIEIFTDSPIAASNFLILASDKFYDGLIFHRVEDWVVQGGDPTGTGQAGPGYSFEDEQVNRKYTKGIVAMANSGPNTNGSQFFILKKDTPLEPKYTIFGQVIKGQEVVDKLKVGDKMTQVVIGNLQ